MVATLSVVSQGKSPWTKLPSRLRLLKTPLEVPRLLSPRLLRHHPLRHHRPKHPQAETLQHLPSQQQPWASSLQLRPLQLRPLPLRVLRRWLRHQLLKGSNLLLFRLRLPRERERQRHLRRQLRLFSLPRIFFVVI
jgi:hypothetical protein